MNPSHTALIIIDMQKGMASPTLPARNNLDAEEHIGTLLQAWRGAGRPVVCVRHMSRSPASVFWPGQPGAEFQARFAPLAHEHVVEKNVPDVFAQSGLERWLHVRAIRELVIVGVSTNNSVESSARSAGNLGFATVVVADACYAYEQRDFGGTLRSAEDVHLMALANLASDYARIMSSAQLLAACDGARDPAAFDNALES